MRSPRRLIRRWQSRPRCARSWRTPANNHDQGTTGHEVTLLTTGDHWGALLGARPHQYGAHSRVQPRPLRAGTGHPCWQGMLAVACALTHSRLHSGQAERVFSHRWMQSCRVRGHKGRLMNNDVDGASLACGAGSLGTQIVQEMFRKAPPVAMHKPSRHPAQKIAKQSHSATVARLVLHPRPQLPPAISAHQVEHVAAGAPGNGQARVVSIACGGHSAASTERVRLAHVGQSRHPQPAAVHALTAVPLPRCSTLPHPRLTGRVGLILYAWLVQVVAADGTRVGANGPGPPAQGWPQHGGSAVPQSQLQGVTD